MGKYFARIYILQFEGKRMQDSGKSGVEHIDLLQRLLFSQNTVRKRWITGERYNLWFKSIISFAQVVTD